MLESLWLEPIVLHFCHTQRQLHMCPWSTMVCSQPAAWTLNLSLLVASCVKAFPVGPTLHLGSTLASLNMQPTPHGFIPHSYRPPPQSLPAPNPPWLWLICPLFTHSSSASMGHHQASVVTQQQRATTSVMAVHNNQFSWGVSSILLATLQAQASMVLADVTWYQVFFAARYFLSFPVWKMLCMPVGRDDTVQVCLVAVPCRATMSTGWTLSVTALQHDQHRLLWAGSAFLRFWPFQLHLPL